MSYVFQSFVVNQVHTAAAANQTEINIRDHAHGLDGVSSVVVGKNTSINDVNNTTAETALVSFTLPANILGTDRMLEMWFLGDVLNNTGVSEVFTMRLRYGPSGSTTIIGSAGPSIGTNATRRNIFVHLVLMGAGATNAQMAKAWLHLFSVVGNVSESIDGAGARTVAEHLALAIDDTASTNVIQVTAQFATASVNLSARHRNSRLYALR